MDKDGPSTLGSTPFSSENHKYLKSRDADFDTLAIDLNINDTTNLLLVEETLDD
jgi:hypothetical protein